MQGRGDEVDQDGHSGAAGESGEATDMADYGKPYGGSLKNLRQNLRQNYDSAIQLLGIYPN